jgi:hypothetical protein
MEKAKFPMPTMKITQGYNIGSHKGAYALDMAGEDAGIDWVLAPFTGTIKYTISSKSVGNWYWFESDEEVLCANGEKTKLVMMIGHDNKMRHKVGDVIKQGEHLCCEGTSGNATGNHCHMEIGKGSYAGTWYKNSDGVYMIYNAVKPNEYLCVPDNYVIENNGGYSWKKESEVSDGHLRYRAQGEDYGWQDWVNEGETAGTIGQSKRLEAIQIDTDLEVQAKAHLESTGWVDYGTINKDTIIGTVGEWRRLECLCLKGDFKYRVYVEGTGWTQWTLADGITTMGTVGQSLRIEAIEIVKN